MWQVYQSSGHQFKTIQTPNNAMQSWVYPTENHRIQIPMQLQCKLQCNPNAIIPMQDAHSYARSKTPFSKPTFSKPTLFPPRI